VAVFVDGCFWHGCPVHGHRPQTNARYWHAKIGGNVERDARNVGALQQSGWQVVRAWEHEDPSDVADRVFRVVSDRRSELG
jgi:DNA mismatch endonuclease, patch repair protein